MKQYFCDSLFYLFLFHKVGLQQLPCIFRQMLLAVTFPFLGKKSCYFSPRLRDPFLIICACSGVHLYWLELDCLTFFTLLWWSRPWLAFPWDIEFLFGKFLFYTFAFTIIVLGVCHLTNCWNSSLDVSMIISETVLYDVKAAAYTVGSIDTTFS